MACVKVVFDLLVVTSNCKWRGHWYVEINIEVIKYANVFKIIQIMLNYGKNMQNIQRNKIHKRETIEPLELWKSDILKVDILRDETFSFEILC